MRSLIIKSFKFLSLFLVFLFNDYYSQEIIKKNYKHSDTHYENRHHIDTFSINNLSFIFTENDKNSTMWKVHFLDSNLNTYKKINTGIENYFSFISSYQKGSLHSYLFAKTLNDFNPYLISKFALYAFYVYDLKDSSFSKKFFYLNKPMSIKNFSYNDSIIYINGLSRKNKHHQVTFKKAINSDTVYTLEQKNEICYNYLDCINTHDTIYNLVFKKTLNKERKLCIDKIETKKLTSTTLVLKSSPEKTLYYSMFYNITNEKKLLIGTYYDTNKKHKKIDFKDGDIDVEGIYISELINLEQQNLKFYPFTKIKSFVEKIPDEFEYGKEVIIIKHVTPKRKDSLVFVNFEIQMNTYQCDIKPNALQKNFYLPQSYYYNIILVFDNQGNLLNDYTFEKLNKSRFVSKFNFNIFEDKLFLYELSTTNLFFLNKDLKKEELTDNYKQYSFIDIEQGKLVWGSTENFNYWYKNYFVASGMYFYKLGKKKNVFYNITKIPSK